MQNSILISTITQVVPINIGTDQEVLVSIYDPLEDEYDFMSPSYYQQGAIYGSSHEHPLGDLNPHGKHDYNFVLPVQADYFIFDHLGSTRVIYHPLCELSSNEISYELDAVYDYFLFGKILRKYEANKEKFLFTHKERDNETNYDYFGARYYDSDIGRFMSVDPLAEERSWVSSFNYVQNNPISRIDPTGALDDDYQLREDGSITLLKKTDDATDKIYNSDKSESITVSKKFLGGANSIEAKDRFGDDIKVDFSGTIEGADKSKEILEFFADNTNIEYSLEVFQFGEGQEYGILSTSNQPSVTYGGSYFINMLLSDHRDANIVQSWHSHPYINGKSDPPSGFYFKNGVKIDALVGDKRFYTNLKNSWGKRMPNYFNLYDPNTKSSYQYDNNGYKKL